MKALGDGGVTLIAHTEPLRVSSCVFYTLIRRKEFQMNTAAVTIATIGTLAALIATAPAEARGLRGNRVAVGAAVATAVAVGVAASTYGYGPGHSSYGPVYYEPGYVVTGHIPSIEDFPTNGSVSCERGAVAPRFRLIA